MPLRLGLIGYPVEHSISPALQQPALDTLNADAQYELWSTSVDELAERVQTLRADDCLGANVTAPHKQAVVPLLDDVAESAERLGAVNTIVNAGGTLIGHNTDVHGLATAIRQNVNSPQPNTVVILGAGGAARAAAVVAEQLGSTEIILANRTMISAELLIDSLQLEGARATDRQSRAFKNDLQTASLLVNATSLGWTRGESPLTEDEISELPNEAFVVDLVYRDTDLLEAARARGLNTLDGLPMLVHQGSRALELWTGQTPPVDLMMASADRARAENG